MSEFKSFISSMKQRGLLPSNRFEVKIPGFGVGKDLLLMCDAVQFPGLALPATDLAIFGEKTAMATGSVTYDDITLSFILDSDMRARAAMEAWMLQVFNTKSRKANYYREYVRDVEITVLDRSENGANTANATRRVTLREAWPKSMSEVEFNYNSSEVARMRVTLAFKWFDSTATVAQTTNYQAPTAAKYSPGAAPRTPATVGGFNLPGDVQVTSFAQGEDPLGEFINSLSMARDQSNGIKQLSGPIASAAAAGGNPGSISMAESFGDFGSQLHTTMQQLHSAVDGAAAVSTLSQTVTDGGASFSALEAAVNASTASMVALEDTLAIYRQDVGGDDVQVRIGSRDVWLSELEDMVTNSRSNTIGKAAELDAFKDVNGVFDPTLKGPAYSTAASTSILSITDSLGIANSALAVIQNLPAAPDFTMPAQLQAAKVSQQCQQPLASLSLNTGTILPKLNKLF